MPGRLEYVLAAPGSEGEVAELLGVLPSQARAWLQRAGSDGKVERARRPVRYQLARDHRDDRRQATLFDCPLKVAAARAGWRLFREGAG